MDVIHFTHVATDPLHSFESKGVSVLPLADGTGDTHVSCAHLDPGAVIDAPSLTHAATLLVVHGRITLTKRAEGPTNIKIHAGLGFVVDKQEPYSLRSDTGAIVVIVEATTLTAHSRGIASPERIAGQTWPSDVLVR